MPNAEDAVLDDLEEKLKTARPVSSLIAEGATAQDIVANYLPGTEVQFLEEKPIHWHCNCSRERIGGLLKSIGITELEDILEKDGQTDVVCHFCSTQYHFGQEELEQLLAEMNADLGENK